LSQKEINLTLTIFALIAQDATTYRIEVKAAVKPSRTGSMAFCASTIFITWSSTLISWYWVRVKRRSAKRSKAKRPLLGSLHDSRRVALNPCIYPC